MRKLLTVGAVLAALVFPSASHAQFQLGARLGYGLAQGDAYKFKSDGSSATMSDGIDSMIPIQIDAGYKVTPEIAVGAYFSYGFGQPGGDLADVCDLDGVDCSLSSVRFGVQGTYDFTKVSPTFVPWVGLGIGYEWASFSVESGGAKAEESLSGFEFLNLQVGGDYKVNPKFAVGLYAMYSFGQYSSGESKISGFGPGIDGSEDFSNYADTAMHQWLTFGIRGKFDL